jgi:quinol monooxygenase YgiN
MSQKIDVVAHIHAAPGNEALVREVLEGFVAPTRKEDGCLRYDLFNDLSDPKRFTFIEEWTSTEALDKHSKSEHIVSGRARLDGKLDGPSWVQVLTQVL